MKTRAEIEAALDVLGWKLSDGPQQTSGGWKVTAQPGNESMLTAGETEMEVLRDLLKLAMDRAKGGA